MIDVTHPSHRPNSVVFGDPASSSTTSTSSSAVSTGGGSEIRSESPEPRRSITISREKLASRARNPASDGYSHAYSTFERKPLRSNTSGGPSPTIWYASDTFPFRA